MKKIWLIARSTYSRRVRSGSFLVLVFVIPILMVAAGAIPVLLLTGGGELPRVGFVDATGRLPNQPAQVSLDEGLLQFSPYASLEAAQAAVQAGEIEAILVIPEGYLSGEPLVFYGQEEPSARLETGLGDFLRRSLLTGQPQTLADRLDNPANVTYVSTATGERLTEGPEVLIRFATPALLGLIFMFSVMLTTSQLGAAVVREKERRALEMVLTSIRPYELVAGKILGMSLLSLTQIAVWTLAGAIAAGFWLFSAADVQTISLPWTALVWGLVLFIPGYLLFAVLAAGLGLLAGDSQQAAQLAGLLGFTSLIPAWLVGTWLNNPNGPVAVAMTLFPLTGPATALLRMSFTEVPVWQLWASLGLIVLSLVAGIWLVSRLFRSAILLVGQSFSPAEVWRILRGA